jgi:predicted nucleotidyltransferase
MNKQAFARNQATAESDVDVVVMASACRFFMTKHSTEAC